MAEDFTVDNCEVWIDNWKRRESVGNVIARSYFNSWPELKKLNVITNHSSVVLEDFPEDIRDKIKLWPNVLRHDLSRGPINKNINQAYVHTFLSGKKYCVFAHDSYTVQPGWVNCIKSNDYDWISSPQGDGFHVMTLQGLKTFGWWDERYATMGWHEIDMLCRVLRKSYILGEGKASIVDLHGLWPNELPFVRGNHTLFYNSIGLENYVQRLDKGTHPQIGSRKNDDFTKRAEEWHKQKWPLPFDAQPHGTGMRRNLQSGPNCSEINWMPWINLDDLGIDRTDY